MGQTFLYGYSEKPPHLVENILKDIDNKFAVDLEWNDCSWWSLDYPQTVYHVDPQLVGD